MPGPVSALDLLSQVRQQIDESNTESISDSDIYMALNRGQRKAANILVKHYEDFFMTFTQVTTDAVSGNTYPIPINSFGRRVSEVLVVKNSIEYPLKRVRFSDLHKFSSTIQVRLPSVFATQQRNLVIGPTPMAGVVLKFWYPAAPEAVVKPQGRITAVNTGGNYVLLDSLGPDLTTDVPSLGAFVNVVDAQTGQIKVSLQTQAVTPGTTPKLTFLSTPPSQATVYGRTIGTALPTGNVNQSLNVNVNDYVCMIQGTCVPDLPDACLDFLVQYAVNEIKRRLGEPVSDEKALLDELMADVQDQWAGRQAVSRIRNTANHWTR